MIAVTFALPSESRAFRARSQTFAGHVVILHTGVGAETCRARIEPFLDAHPLDFLISSGFAGGVEPSLGAGDLFLAANFSDPNLLHRAQALLPAATHTARLATVGRIVKSAGERAALAQQVEAAAVDMETACIAQACARRRIPLLSLRIISDTAATPFPAPPGVLFDLVRQKTDYLRLGGYLARHPAAIVRLIRFGRQIEASGETLANALEVLVAGRDP